MDESDFDHMMTPFNVDAFSPNQHATAHANEFGNLYSAIEDMPNASDLLRGTSLAGSSNPTLDIVTAVDMANFMQPSAPQQGHRIDEPYGIFPIGYQLSFAYTKNSQPTTSQQTTLRPLHVTAMAFGIAISIKPRMIRQQWERGLLLNTKRQISIPQQAPSE
jgi:hypothetical protein